MKFFTKRHWLKLFPEGQHVSGTFDVLLQSGMGTQRLTLIKYGEHWRAGNEIEQIGVVQQEVVDILGSVISQVQR